MIFKMSFFHECTHEDTSSDDLENCEICELATKNKHDKFIFITSIVVKTPVFINNTYKPSISYVLALTSSFLHSSFFGRPPPQVS